jgi:hypothetical protein
MISSQLPAIAACAAVGVLDRNDWILLAPNDERGHPGGQVELVVRAHRLTARVDDCSQRA